MKLFEINDDFFYEEILAVFEDNVYFLMESRKILLETAFTVNRNFPQQTPGGNHISVRLLQLDDQTYREKFDIPNAELSVKTDTSWWYRHDKIEDWQTMTSPGEGWSHPSMPLGSTLSWSTILVGSAVAEQATDTFYILKNFNVPGYILSAQLEFQADTPEQIFVNSVSLDGRTGEKSFDIKESIIHGNNVIALRIANKAHFSMYADIKIEFIPLQNLN